MSNDWGKQSLPEMLKFQDSKQGKCVILFWVSGVVKFIKMDQMEYLKSLCRKIIRNEVDHFDLWRRAINSKSIFLPVDDFSHKKYQLKHAVLSEILKEKNLSDNDKNNNEEMKETTSKLLKL